MWIKIGGGYGRDFTIDILRAISIFLIILAHVNPPREIQALRTFDVVCMVFISGISFSFSRKKVSSVRDYLNYLLKRIKRLVVPTWIFLSVYFLLFWVLSSFIHEFEFYSIKTIALSYGLYYGIGYVWIIRIYVCMAAIGPILEYIYCKIIRKNVRINLLSISVATLIYHAISIIKKNKVNFIDLVILPIFGYAIVYYAGICYRDMKLKHKLCLIAMFMLWLLAIILKCGFLMPQDFKYPPQMYYLAFGMACTVGLALLFGRAKIKGKFGHMIVFISKNSMNIYLIHIFFVSFLEIIECTLAWYWKYIIVVSCTLCIIILVKQFKNFSPAMANKSKL